jgi:hypothetical protein
MRRDLVALTADDLAALSNRGLVKRAQRDLESGAGAVRVDELADGTIEAEWPDQAVVRLQPDQPINDRACSCLALSICRHTIGTILAYQALTPITDVPNAAWNPGEIADQTLSGFWTSAVWSGVEKLWAAGLVAELHRGVKPVARLLSLGVTLRFLVPHDARYTQCDCVEESPCRHVPLAVRAFRKLDPAQSTGLISTQESAYSRPVEIIEEGRQLVLSLLEHGLANLPPNDIRHWEAFPATLRRRQLLWPAEIAAELLAARDHYLQHDARFEPAAVARLAAEFVIRLRAISAATGSVPQLFLRGSARDEAADLPFSRFTGLGCHVDVRRKSAVLSVPLHDVATGAISVARREIVNPADSIPKDFSTLAGQVFSKNVTLAQLGGGNLLIQGAKRTINGELTATRARLSLSPQSYEWEKLRRPVLVEGFEELRAHRDAQPPALLRPRRLAEDMHVCPVARVESLLLHSANRWLSATLVDASGETLMLIQPFYSRARSGFSILAEILQRETIRYVSGRLRQTALGLAIEPAAVVFEKDGRRQMLQPWIATDPSGGGAEWSEAAAATNALSAFLGNVEEALGEAVLLGISQADAIMERRWRALIEQGEQLGLSRFLEPARRLSAALRNRQAAIHPSALEAVQAALDMAIVTAFGIGESAV